MDRRFTLGPHMDDIAGNRSRFHSRNGTRCYYCHVSLVDATSSPRTWSLPRRPKCNAKSCTRSNHHRYFRSKHFIFYRNGSNHFHHHYHFVKKRSQILEGELKSKGSIHSFLLAISHSAKKRISSKSCSERAIQARLRSFFRNCSCSCFILSKSFQLLPYILKEGWEIVVMACF